MTKKRKTKLYKSSKPLEYNFTFADPDEPREEIIPEEGTLEKYAYDVKQYLMYDAWKYPEDVAESIISNEYYRLEQGYKNGASIEDIAIEIGYFCG